MVASVWPFTVVCCVPLVPGFRGISSLAAPVPVFPRPCTAAFPLSIDSLCQTGTKNCWWGRGGVMSESVVVYTLPECQPCRMTKMKLDQVGVSYTVVEMESTSWSGFRPEIITALAI
ncbi:hypothetical protein B7495_17995 (plasmid) [Cryobacterium sp. LW097]|uniref:glutaredoxin domain-containing protein n=2 Tax=unclassified Cryobacterium TaxID=2649013 RepID=UPI000B4CBCCF|nr:hypothetical protein B7495_17995 [Cryobacterium sp. LW097]